MDSLAELLGNSRAIAIVREKLGRLLAHQQKPSRLPPVLLQGETGTGKGLVAHLIHRHGARRTGPFVDVNCAAIPPTLLEAELFGFERGAFTDARHSKPGLFQTAHHGVLFLDEIGLLPEALQGKLLKVIEEGAVRRLGSVSPEPVDVWVLAASSENLAAAARTGRFRPDLYHRLAVVTLELPPLRERREDILLLAEYFLARAVSDYGLAPTTLATDARAALVDYAWPGNIRELANVMERVALLTQAPEVTARNLGLTRSASPGAAAAHERVAPTASAAEEETEQARITEALRRTDWNVSRAAVELGISREKLRYRMQKYQLQADRVAAPSRAARRRPPTPPPARVEALAPRRATAMQWTHQVLALLRASLIGGTEEEASVEHSRSLEVLVDKVQGFGGRVEDVSPRGLVAAFGLDGAGDAATRAALAALAIQRVGERARRIDEWSVTGKIVIHTGRFLVGQLGGAPQIAIDAKRQAVEVLDALISRTTPGTVVVSGTTLPFVDRRFDAVPLDPGGREEHRAYRLSVRANGASRAHNTRFVGRRGELALLRNRLALALAGQPQVVGIVGEPGIGKSRLLFEFRETVAAEAAAFLTGHCLPSGSNTPYLPILEMLRDLCRLTDGDTADQATEKVRLTLEANGVDTARAAPYLFELLALAGRPDELLALSAEAVRGRTFTALRDLFLSLGRRRPLVLAVEDLHWIDTTSEEFLASLVEELPSARVLFVSTYRPGYRPPWAEKSYASQIALSQLSREESEGLLASILPGECVAGAVAPLILAKADGNPFFLEELARAVAREAPGAAPTIPDTVQDVLLARINQLPPEAKEVVQIASVCGRTVSARLLDEVWAGPGGLEPHLRELVRREFLYLEDETDEATYVFKHSLTQDVAYQSLFEGTRRRHHERVAEVLAGKFPHVVESQPEVLAHHYTEGGLGREAVAAWLRAGQLARGRSAYTEASNHLRKGLAVLAALPATPERAEQELALQLALGGALLTASSFAAPEVAEAYTRARELCGKVGRGSRLFNALSGLEAFHTARGELRQAQELGEQCLSLARDLGEPSLVCRASNALGSILVHRGWPQAASEHLREALARVDVPPDRPAPYRSSVYHPRVFALSYQSWALWLLGCAKEAGAASTEALELAQRLSHPHSSALASHYASVLAQLRSDGAEARRLAEAVIAAARDQGFRTYVALGGMMHGWTVADAGDLEAGAEEMRHGLAIYRETGTDIGRPYFLGLLADTHHRAGRVGDALQTLDAALAVGDEHDEHAWDAELLRLKAEMLASIGDEPQARRCFDQAIGVAREQGAVGWERRLATRAGTRPPSPRGYTAT